MNLIFPCENTQVLASTAEATRLADKQYHPYYKFSEPHLSSYKYRKVTHPTDKQYRLHHRFSEPHLSSRAQIPKSYLSSGYLIISYENTKKPFIQQISHRSLQNTKKPLV
jgi:hypothetical protein